MTDRFAQYIIKTAGPLAVIAGLELLIGAFGLYIGGLAR